MYKIFIATWAGWHAGRLIGLILYPIAFLATLWVLSPIVLAYVAKDKAKQLYRRHAKQEPTQTYRVVEY